MRRTESGFVSRVQTTKSVSSNLDFTWSPPPGKPQTFRIASSGDEPNLPAVSNIILSSD
jgi:hypothetical protein